MKYTNGFNKLELPDYFKFGIELEANNVRTKGKESLYSGQSADYIKSKNWHMATKYEESLVGKGGAELVSPVLSDTEQTWENIANICTQMKKFPGNNGKEVIADDKCGLHIHFDASCLSKDPNKMKTFLNLYAESEELLYKMCNPKDNPIRKGAINKNFRGLSSISAMWRNGMAAPTGKKLLKHLNNGTLKVSYKKFGTLKKIISRYKLDERRYSGLNLTNIGNSRKNTIEFRMANGTLNPEVIKQNVFLYASLIETAIKVSETPNLYQDRLTSFFRTNITEKEKAQSFLHLIMENEEDRKIYMDRWESVKDASVFQKNHKKGFAQNRFTREQFKHIAERTPPYMIHSAFSYIKGLLTKDRGEYNDR